MRALSAGGALAAAVATRSPKRRDLVMTVIQELMCDPTADLSPDFLVRLSRLLYM
jgi:8-hydroxy-5-deazaflavin:NADPH oxidoreductase